MQVVHIPQFEQPVPGVLEAAAPTREHELGHKAHSPDSEAEDERVEGGALCGSREEYRTEEERGDGRRDEGLDRVQIVIELRSRPHDRHPQHRQRHQQHHKHSTEI